STFSRYSMISCGVPSTTIPFMVAFTISLPPWHRHYVILLRVPYRFAFFGAITLRRRGTQLVCSSAFTAFTKHCEVHSITPLLNQREPLMACCGSPLMLL